MDIIDSIWITDMRGNTIGFVAVRITEGWKVYAGSLGTDIISEEVDARRIAQMGGKLPAEMAIAIFPRLNPDEYIP